MNFSKIDKKYVTIAPLLYVMLIGSFGTLLNSIDTGETWRIAFAVTGFVIFAGLALIYTCGIYTEISKQEK